ncbi:MAG TPA: hypothetical protein VIG24_02080 [Acidimicrobiia bacterium]
MSWKVMSKRLAWPAGTVLGADDLAGCNIEALVQGGHLAPVAKKQEPAPKVDGPRRKTKVEPEEPETDDDSAEEPEEQE